MKKALLSTAILLATTAAAEAKETWPRWYIGLGAGATIQSDADVTGVGGVTEAEFKTGSSFTGALGYRLQPDESLLGNGSIELEISRKNQDIDNTADGEVTATTYMVNYVEHLGSGSSATPFIGAGIGYANIETEIGALQGDDDVAAYQFIGGIGYQPETMPRTRLKVGYKYLGTFEDPSFATGESEYDSHTVEVGAEFHF